MLAETIFEIKMCKLAMREYLLSMHKIVGKLSEAGTSISKGTINRVVYAAEKERTDHFKSEKRLNPRTYHF